MCLLCATLAWRETYIAHLQLNLKVHENKASGDFCDDLQENLGQAAVGWSSGENNCRFHLVLTLNYIIWKLQQSC